MTYLAVFDWNGTLFDDMAATHEATNASLAFFGKGPITLEEEQETFTFPLIHFYEKMGINADDYLRHTDELSRLFVEVYERENVNCGLREGSIELLDWLAANNVTCKILSNHRQDHLDHDVGRFGIAHYFHEISGNADPATIVQGLSKQFRLEDYMARHGFTADKTFIIGDSHEELELARHLKLTGISISGGLMTPTRLARFGADYCIDHMAEVRPILEDLWRLAA
jgi:phosphoglycolate phosphatase